MKYIIVEKNDPTFKHYEEDIYHLRYKVFKEQLNWDVETFNEKEIDYFDSLEKIHYILIIDSESKLIGCMRLLPTVKDYMLEKVFPFLVDNQIPKEENIWELSRFAVHMDVDKTNTFNFNKATLLLIKGICEFSKEQKISSYVAVTTDRMQRLVRKLKMDATLLGTQHKISDTNVLTLQIQMNDKSFFAIDAALV